MSEFGTTGKNKIKMIRTVSKVRTDTDSGKLKWKILVNEKDYKIFSTSIYYTEKKYITIYVRTSNTSTEKNNNSLKIMYKVYGVEGNYNSTVLTTIYLHELPSLLGVIKLLWKKYLGIDFITPNGIFKPSVNTKNIPVIEIDNVDDYRKEILKSIKSFMRNLDRSVINWDDVFLEIQNIYEEARDSKDFNELNDLLYKASVISKKHNRIGKPKWDTHKYSEEEEEY